jgi:hypothetical protein
MKPKAHFEPQYSNVELDPILRRIVNYNSENVLRVNWSDFKKGEPDIENYYFKCKYLRAFGYVKIEEHRDSISNQLYHFDVTITDKGFRFLADGGFEGKYRREIKEKEEVRRHQKKTRTISIWALVVSLLAFLSKIFEEPIKDLIQTLLRL